VVGVASTSERAKRRADEFFSRYKMGETLEQIGKSHKITRERVRQVLKKCFGITGKDGGGHVRSEASAAARRAQRDAAYMVRFGCTHEQWRSVPRVRPGTPGYYRSPMGAFQNQRNNAGRRGIEWKLTFWQWWQVWMRSGHWSDRGRVKGGYVMSRNADTGPYSVENVSIILATDNVQEYYNRERTLYGRVRSGQERKAA
jgi:hypothetical protein